MNSLDWHVGRLRAMGRHADADRLEDFTLTRAWPESVPRLPDDAEAPAAPQNATGRPPRSSGQKERSMATIKVNPTEVYSAHVGGNGDAGIVAATIAVHRPTGRTVETWTAEDEVVLGEPVSDLEARGYTVTPRAR